MKAVFYTRTAATALRRHANRAKLIRTKIAQYAEDASSQAHNAKSLVGVAAKRFWRLIAPQWASINRP
jgi:mRNA interferase RelE/StbE